MVMRCLFRSRRLRLAGAMLAAGGLLSLLLPVQPAAAGGYGYHRQGGYYAPRRGVRAGAYVRRGYPGRGRYYRYRPGARLRYYAPAYVASLYVPPLYVVPGYPRVVTVVPPVSVERISRASPALPDMPSFQYTPLQGQDAARLTEDRRACESIAWRVTRPDPATELVRVSRSVQGVVSPPYPGSPLPRAAGGAALGAVGGAIAGDAGLGAAIGAAVGAASWLVESATAPPVYYQQEVVEREYVPAPGPDPRALRAALMACMEGRGYEVR